VALVEKEGVAQKQGRAQEKRNSIITVKEAGGKTPRLEIPKGGGSEKKKMPGAHQKKRAQNKVGSWSNLKRQTSCLGERRAQRLAEGGRHLKLKKKRK